MFQIGQFMKRGGGSGLLLASLVATGACTTVDDDGGGVPSGDPVARVQLDNGATVSFYETSPGAIGIAQTFPEDTTPIETDGKTAVEVFQEIAPGQAVPEALIAAQQRADEARASRPHAEYPPAASPTDPSSITDSDFIDNYCSGNWDVIRYLPLHRNYPSTYSNDDADEVKFSVCANVGNVSMRAYIDGDLKGPWDILEGYCSVYHWESAWINAVVSADVFNVNSSDRYDFCMRVRH